jgi:hypothetical protein
LQFTTEEMNCPIEIIGSDVSGIFDHDFIISKLGPVQGGTGLENTVISTELCEFKLLESAL